MYNFYTLRKTERGDQEMFTLKQRKTHFFIFDNQHLGFYIVVYTLLVLVLFIMC